MQGHLSQSRKSVVVLLLVLAAAAASSVAQLKPPAMPAANSLYKRLGGYDALASITDDFLKALQQDKQFERFGTGRAMDSKLRTRQLVVDQLCALTGGPCVYIGREMKTAHQGLGITEVEWDASVKHLESVLDKHEVPKKEHEEVVAAVAKLKPDIVEPAKK